MTQLDPRVAEPESTEAAEAYDAWFPAKGQKAMAERAPTIPHDQVMTEMEAIIVAAERRRACPCLSRGSCRPGPIQLRSSASALPQTPTATVACGPARDYRNPRKRPTSKHDETPSRSCRLESPATARLPRLAWPTRSKKI